MTLRIELTDNMFGEKERQLLTMGALRVSTFRYDNGIAALRVANARGELIILPV